MFDEPTSNHMPAPASPVTEADLHGFVDGQLSPARLAEVKAHLAQHADQAATVRQWQADSQGLRQRLDAVLAEPVPARLITGWAEASASSPTVPLRHPWWRWQQAAACAALAVLAAGGGWFAHGAWAGRALQATTAAAPLPGFAQRAAVAHAVYTPELRRPVEVGGDQEQQLVTWLSKRLGTAIKAPALAPLGYQLVGGRLLPGEAAAVAQFMYQNPAGQRLTLYVTREVPAAPGQPDTAFHFGQMGSTQVFYWVDRGFGYALSGAADRPTLQRVSTEVYRQLAPG